jgi:hypothetical protein
MSSIKIPLGYRPCSSFSLVNVGAIGRECNDPMIEVGSSRDGICLGDSSV